ncbi:hypothetical protein BCR33DRAFT_713026 [Rhizoclosmatium globosum]|uniref:Uncharacterized protein n=1 Tax=Rhizoclosmatium globosum TaxID=329046 RepID=A0A1Y2CW20_9FUNG|nr:hypothetical protein BCR33DRAFT_713026 [Rhizoclosmatium globosum]|eukprot:ORY51106.1 hypothetical protein BCR33DRAFT_713026 [Rhizoclosmatium globosum]
MQSNPPPTQSSFTNRLMSSITGSDGTSFSIFGRKERLVRTSAPVPVRETPVPDSSFDPDVVELYSSASLSRLERSASVGALSRDELTGSPVSGFRRPSSTTRAPHAFQADVSSTVPIPRSRSSRPAMRHEHKDSRQFELVPMERTDSLSGSSSYMLNRSTKDVERKQSNPESLRANYRGEDSLHRKPSLGSNSTVTVSNTRSATDAWNTDMESMVQELNNIITLQRLRLENAAQELEIRASKITSLENELTTSFTFKNETIDSLRRQLEVKETALETLNQQMDNLSENTASALLLKDQEIQALKSEMEMANAQHQSALESSLVAREMDAVMHSREIEELTRQLNVAFQSAETVSTLKTEVKLLQSQLSTFHEVGVIIRDPTSAADRLAELLQAKDAELTISDLEAKLEEAYKSNNLMVVEADKELNVLNKELKELRVDSEGKDIDPRDAIINSLQKELAQIKKQIEEILAVDDSTSSSNSQPKHPYVVQTAMKGALTQVSRQLVKDQLETLNQTPKQSLNPLSDSLAATSSSSALNREKTQIGVSAQETKAFVAWIRGLDKELSRVQDMLR